MDISTIEAATSAPRSDWRTEVDEQGVAWVSFDRADQPANTLGERSLAGLSQVLDRLADQGIEGLVFLSDKPGGFIAGADIREFSALEGPDQALALVERGQRTMDRIEALPFPTVAMIHGYCLGGGLELALACDYRVVEESARLGLPEVSLGIHPGFGGSMRIVRLLGPSQGLDLVLTGRTIDTGKARRIGLVDESVPRRHLRAAARSWVVRPLPARRRAARNRYLSLPPVRQGVSALIRHRLRRRVSAEHYPAPFAQLDVWSRAGGDPRAMLRAEAASVAELATTDTARNLVRLFFLRERLKALGKEARDALDDRPIHVIGAGAMGGDIAAWCAFKGRRVTFQDTRPEVLAKALLRAKSLFERRLPNPRSVEAAFDRLIPDPGGAGVARAGLVIEAIVEDLDAKRELLAGLERRVSADTVLASNTSSIPLEDVAQRLARPERFVGLHFFNPVSKMQLVEVVRGRESGDGALRRALALVGQIDRLPLPVASSPGFLVNRILMPYLLEAARLVEEGVPVEQIDSAATEFGMPVGPLLLADSVGLDICLSVARVLTGSLGGDIPEVLPRMVARGQLGKKSGAGFYRHAERKPRPRYDLGRIAGAADDIRERLTLRLINEAAACVREGVVEDPDLVDAGMVFGTGFAPFRGGPLHYGVTLGRNRLNSESARLVERYGRRFSPDPAWKDLAETGRG